MAIINHSYSFVFVHIPKAAGTSITNLLSGYTKYCDLELGGTQFGEKIAPHYRRRFGLRKHSTAIELRSVIGQQKWDEMFKFAFCRNPYDRCYSAFNFLRKWESPNRLFNREIRKFKTFDDFVESDIFPGIIGPDNIFSSQVNWLTEKNGQGLLVDFVGDLDNLAAGTDEILRRIDPDYEGGVVVPSLNKTKKLSKLSGLSSRVKDKVYDKYQDDFKFLSSIGLTYES